MRRRLWLAAALGSAAGLLTTDWLEAAVNSPLYFDVLDDDSFPELRVEIGRKAIQLRHLQPPGDSRVPASVKTQSLLAAWRLDEPDPPKDPRTPPPGWVLAFDAPDKQGVLQRVNLPLFPRPDPNVQVFATPDPNMPHVPGMVYRGALWADLGPLFAQKLLRPGMVVELSFGTQARAQLRLG